MFRDKHDFNAIAVSSVKLQSLREALLLFPAAAISEPERVVASAHFEAVHFFYHSHERFSRSAELEEVRVNWNDEEQFRYNMYGMHINYNDKVLFIFAVPFFSMGRAVFGEFSRAAHGLGLVFHAIDLPALVSAVQESHNEGGLVKISKIDLLVHGDTPVDRVLLAGTDVVNSLTFERLFSSAAEAQTQLNPRRCTIAFDDHKRSRFVLGADRHGNLSFRVSHGASNIETGRDLIFYLLREGLVTETFAFPPSRGGEEEERKLE